MTAPTGFGPPRGHARADDSAPVPRRLSPTRRALALRGLVAAVVLVFAVAAVVGYGNGYFASDPHVTAVVPAEAGLITGRVGVQYDGVPVGEVTAIDAGTDESTAHMRIDSDAIESIPAGVEVRVTPRTLFGDVLLQLVPDPSAGTVRGHLRGGDRLSTDTSPQAVKLYDVYQRSMRLMDRLEPQQLQTSLTAAATALRGKGRELGRSLERMAGAADTLAPVADHVLDRSGELASVAEAARDATGDGLAIVRDLTDVSQVVLDDPDGLAQFFAAAGASAGTVDVIADEQSARLADVIGQSAPILSTAAAGRAGLPGTFDALDHFALKGAPVFSSGRFAITAVPSFADPEPYTAADCPRYGTLAGANCDGGGR